MAVGLALTPWMGSAATATASDSTRGSVDSAETLEMLYAVDAPSIRVVPGKGASARVVLRRPTITQFTDRPARDAVQVHPAMMLGSFGWTEESGRLRGSRPNAAISLVGADTQVVRIRKAVIREDRVILRVSGITGPVTSVRGAGSIFVDSATVNVLQTQSVQLWSAPELTMTGTVYSNSTMTITFRSASAVVANRTFIPNLGGSQWNPSFTLPGDIQVVDLSVFTAFFPSSAHEGLSATVDAQGEIATLPDGARSPGIPQGTLQFEDIPPPPSEPWPPSL